MGKYGDEQPFEYIFFFYLEYIEYSKQIKKKTVLVLRDAGVLVFTNIVLKCYKASATKESDASSLK